MARTELPNGVILPAEYSDDWFEDMTSNLTKLDDVIGSDSEKLNADGVDFLRMSSAALTDGGTGNFSDLNSSYKIKTGDFVLDSGRKLYQIVSVDSTNERFTVGNSLFKVTAESDLAPVAESGDYDDLDNKPDLNPYDQHIANTDIHVTAADKQKWNNQTYVFRYSSTALVASSTNANSLLDNTDNLKVGDKVIDSLGVLFSITAIDTANSTFTIGTALIDLAQDSDVVHKSGNENISGIKTFENNRMVVGRSTDIASAIQLINSNVVGDSANGASSFEVYGSSTSDANKIGSITIGEYLNNGGAYAQIEVNRTESGVKTTTAIRSLIRSDGSKEFSAGVDNDCKLGHPYFRWSEVYATNYYYGNANVEFSTKFVTTDTNQTVSGNKTFTNNVKVKNTDVTRGSTTGSGYKAVTYTDSNDDELSRISVNKNTNGSTALEFKVSSTDNADTVISSSFQFFISKAGNKVINPTITEDIALGRSGNKWSDVVTAKVNGVEPSSLSLPSGNASDVIDISSYLVNLDGTNNTYVAPANGWVSITMNGCSGIQAYINSLWGHQIVRPTVGGVRFLMPILKNLTANILIFGGTIDNARFIPCQGNV